MSRIFEKAMKVLDIGNHTQMGVAPGEAHLTLGKGLCWRCMSNSSRAEDFTCDPCYRWMIGESNEDPREDCYDHVGLDPVDTPNWAS